MKWYVMMKKFLRAFILGVWLGCFGFVVALFVGSATHGGANAFFSGKTGEELLQSAIYMIILTTSVCVAGLIHEAENLAVTLKGIIQMTVFVVVYLAEAYFFGFMEEKGMMYYVRRALGTAVAGWLLGMAIYRIEIELINRKIRDKNRDKKS